MARRRLHLRRLLALIVLVLLCLLLLDLNRFLPGSWPGGGGATGSRPVSTGVLDDPSRVRKPDSPPSPAERPAARLRVEVVAPPSETGASDEIRVGAGTAEKSATLADGRSAVELPSAAVDGGDGAIAIARGGRRVVHGVPRDAARGDVVVAWPASAVPEPPGDFASEVTVRVVDDRGPIANAEVRVTDAKGERVERADANGRLAVQRGVDALKSPSSRPVRSAIVRICASAEGHSETCAFASLDGPAEITLIVPRRVPVETKFVSESGEPLSATTLRIVPAGGAPRTLERPEGGGFAGLSESLPTDLVATGHVEIEVAGRPAARAALSAIGATTVIPAGRSVAVEVAGEDGKPVAGATVTATWPSESGAEPADAARLSATATTGANGIATLVVPKDRAAVLAVTSSGAAPASIAVAGSDTDERKTGMKVTTKAGAALRVRVVSTDEKPVANATVLVLSRVGDATVRATATSDARGIAVLRDLPPGRVEALVHAPGQAWGVASAQAVAGSEASAEARLAPGRRLRLIVEDPLGLPLAGVTVRSSPRPDPARTDPIGVDPDAAPWVTDLNGVLVVDDLPDREFDLFLHRDGYADETVPRARPGDVTYFATLVAQSK